jgi:hypothetical protein
MRVSDKEFLQIYIHSCYEDISEEEIAARIGIDMDEYRARIKVIETRVQKIGPLPRPKRLKEVPF